MRKFFFTGVLLLLLFIMQTGCGTVHYQCQSAKPVFLGSSNAQKYSTIRRVEDNGKKCWLFWWLFPVGTRRDDTLTRFSNAGGDAVMNVCIHESYDFIDFIVQNWSGMLFGVPGITNTLNQNYSAEIVQFEKGR